VDGEACPHYQLGHAAAVTHERRFNLNRQLRTRLAVYAFRARKVGGRAPLCDADGRGFAPAQTSRVGTLKMLGHFVFGGSPGRCGLVVYPVFVVLFSKLTHVGVGNL